MKPKSRETLAPTPKWTENLETLLRASKDSYIPPIFVYGEPATGKTYLCQTVPQPKPVCVTLHRGQPIEELRGMYVPGVNGFEWQDGPVVTAMRTGQMLVINEIGEASDDIVSLLYAVLDRPESSAYTLPSGEAVEPADGFRVVATSNSGPEVLPPAIRSRFAIKVHADTPNPASIAMLPDPYFNAALGTIQQSGDRHIDPRQWHAFMDLKRLMDAHDAIEIVFGKQGKEIIRSLGIATATADVATNAEGAMMIPEAGS